MTRPTRLLLLAAITLALAAVLLVPACRWRVVGWARGEAFYRGRQTSYWRQEVLACTEAPLIICPCPPPAGPFVGQFRPASSVDRARWLLGLSYHFEFFQPLLGDREALPVLVELLRDRAAPVRGYTAGCLAALGPQARGAVPALVEMQFDAEPVHPFSRQTVGRAVCSALRAIGTQAAEAAGVK